jgi:hypothetical protein
MLDDLTTHAIRRNPLRLRALIGGGLAICIGLLLLAFDPSPADRMAGAFLGVGAFFVVVGLSLPGGYRTTSSNPDAN